MKKLSLLPALLPAIVAMGMMSSPASAESLTLEYKRFHSHVRKLESEDLSALQFAFGFKQVSSDRLCDIENAYIHTQKQDIPLTVTPEQRFTVPSEKALRLADAKVMIELQQPANQCDLSVQLETKPDYLKSQYTAEELQFLFGQYQAFFNEMGSFLSFLMPSVQGLMMQFADHDLDARLEHGLSVNKGVLNLTADWLEQGYGLNVPVAPQRITALAKN